MARLKWLLWTLAILALVIASFYFLRPRPYRVLITEFPPYSFMDNGKPSGIAVDIIKEGMKRLKLNYILEESQGDAGSQAIKGPKTMLSIAPKLSSTEKLLKWAGPIAAERYYLYGKRGEAKLGGIDDAKNVSSIGVVRGDLSYDILVGKDFRNLYFATSKEAAFEKMTTGQIALFAGSEYEVKSLLAKKEKDPKEVQNLLFLGNYDLFMAFSRDMSDKEVKRWQGVIDALRKEGFSKKGAPGPEPSFKPNGPAAKKK